MDIGQPPWPLITDPSLDGYSHDCRSKMHFDWLLGSLRCVLIGSTDVSSFLAFLGFLVLRRGQDLFA